MLLNASKPKTHRGRRAAKVRDPKLIENTKTALFIKSTHPSALLNSASADLCALKKPNAINFSKKNEVQPFVDAAPLEFFSKKNDASLFVFGSNMKKRPNHLVFGRTFDHQILDMVELAIKGYIPASEFKDSKGCGVGQKPLFVFSGQEFEHNDGLKHLRSILLDFYRGSSMDAISLNGIEHVISVTADPNVDGLVHFRVYNVLLKKSGTRVPRVELSEMGPHFDFQLGRVRLPDTEMWKQSMRVPKESKAKKIKNVRTTDMGETLGAVYPERQDLSKLQTRKMKGLKRSRDIVKQEVNENVDTVDNADE